MPSAASTADASCAAVTIVAPNPGAVDGVRTAAETTSAGSRITARGAWRIAVPCSLKKRPCQPEIARTYPMRRKIPTVNVAVAITGPDHSTG